MLVVLHASEPTLMSRVYSKYVDYLEAVDSWVLVTRLAQELGTNDQNVYRQMHRLKSLGRVEMRSSDRGPQVKSTRAVVNV